MVLKKQDLEPIDLYDIKIHDITIVINEDKCDCLLPLGDGEGRGTPPPTAAAGEGTDGGVGAGEVRCCAVICECSALLTTTGGKEGAITF